MVSMIAEYVGSSDVIFDRKAPEQGGFKVSESPLTPLDDSSMLGFLRSRILIGQALGGSRHLS